MRAVPDGVCLLHVGEYIRQTYVLVTPHVRTWASPSDRLWHSDGKAGQARTLLEGVYASFEDQNPTADREDARALLETLKTRKRNLAPC